MWPGRSSWTVVGHKRNCSILAGRMSVNVKLARWRKAQRSTGSTIALSGTKSDGRFQRPQEVGAKKQEHQRRSGSGKEVLLCILSVNADGTGAIFSMRKWASEKHKSWDMPAEGFKGHVASDGSLQGTAAKW